MLAACHMQLHLSGLSIDKSALRMLFTTIAMTASTTDAHGENGQLQARSPVEASSVASDGTVSAVPTLCVPGAFECNEYQDVYLTPVELEEASLASVLRPGETEVSGLRLVAWEELEAALLRQDTVLFHCHNFHAAKIGQTNRAMLGANVTLQLWWADAHSTCYGVCCCFRECPARAASRPYVQRGSTEWSLGERWRKLIKTLARFHDALASFVTRPHLFVCFVRTLGSKIAIEPRNSRV